jgi:uncharacterized protein
MKHALIIHGAYGNPHINWFPWAKHELRQRGYTVDVPQLPTPDGQNLDHWLQITQPLMSQLDDGAVLIGHSIGATFLLSCLEKLPIKAVSHTVLVGGFISNLPDEQLNKINTTFYSKEFDWDTLKQHNIIQMHSDNDPFVPLECAQQLADRLEVPLQIIPGAGHFNASSGYTQLPQLLNFLDGK